MCGLNLGIHKPELRNRWLSVRHTLWLLWTPEEPSNSISGFQSHKLMALWQVSGWEILYKLNILTLLVFHCKASKKLKSNFIVVGIQLKWCGWEVISKIAILWMFDDKSHHQRHFASKFLIELNSPFPKLKKYIILKVLWFWTQTIFRWSNNNIAYFNSSQKWPKHHDLSF